MGYDYVLYRKSIDLSSVGNGGENGGIVGLFGATLGFTVGMHTRSLFYRKLPPPDWQGER